MPRKQITDLIAELRSWLPNYNHGPNDYPTVLYRVLAAAPGGDELDDMGYEPIGNLSWHELDQLGRVLETIQDKRDVEDLIRGLMSEEGEEEGVSEAREVRRGSHGRGEIKPYVGATVEFQTSDGGANYGIIIRFEGDTAMVRWTESGTISGVASSSLRVVPSEWGGSPARESVGEVEETRRRSPERTYPEMREAPRIPVDETAAHELALYTVNDGDIYRQTIQPIIQNLAKKIRNGTYNADLAVKAWAYAADAGAKKYTKEFGGSGNGSYGSFSKADREAAAREIGEQYDEEVRAAGSEGPRVVHEMRNRRPPQVNAGSKRRRTR